MQVFTNATFISCEEQPKTFTVLIEDGGVIVFAGDEVPAQYQNARTIDLHGGVAMPAFADTHMHFESYAMFNATVDLRDACDFDDMRGMLQAYVRKHPKTKTLIAFGCSAHTVNEKRLPERKDLDAMLETPLIIVKYDGHAAVANSALIASLPSTVTDDEGFDAQSGWLYQNAFYKGVNCVTSQISPLALLSSMQMAADRLADAGISYVHTVEGVGYKNDIDVDTLRFIQRALPQSFRIFFQTTDVEKVKRRKMKQIGGCFSLALDGCFGSEDAAISSGYANNPDNKGFLLYTQEEIDAFAVRANREGLQIAMHAIGDVAVEQALNAYAAALADTPRKDHRHIIIHADLIPPALIERAASLGVSIALQPNFLRWKQEPPEYLETILGKRASELLPLRDLIDAGVLISAGSDAPCTVPNPIESIHNCCNHPNPAQRVTVLEALKMHTLWAAKACFDEDTRGSLSVLKVCDFVLLDKNPLTIPMQELKTLRVTGTYLRGMRFAPKRLSLPGVLLKAVLGKG